MQVMYAGDTGYGYYTAVPAVHPRHVHLGLEQTDAVHGLEIVFRPPNCIYRRERGCCKGEFSRERFEHSHAKV